MKKFFTNNFLILGGLFFILFLLLPYCDNTDAESASCWLIATCMEIILPLTFLFFVVRMLFHKVPKPLLKFKKECPKIAAYFASIGWMLYAVFAFVLALFIARASDTASAWLDEFFRSEGFIIFASSYFDIALFGLILAGFAFATYYNFFYSQKKMKRPKGQ